MKPTFLATISEELHAYSLHERAITIQRTDPLGIGIASVASVQIKPDEVAKLIDALTAWLESGE